MASALTLSVLTPVTDPPKPDCFPVPPVLELLNPEELNSFMSWLTLRRELYLQHLFDNVVRLSFDHRYIDIFYKELVHSIPRCSVDILRKHFLMPEQDLSIMTQGLLAPHHHLHHFDPFLAVILKKLPNHSPEALQIWSALRAGCFLDPKPMVYPKSMNLALHLWWEVRDRAVIPHHSLTTVVTEWRAWYDGTYYTLNPNLPVPVEDLGDAHNLFQQTSALLSNALERAKGYADFQEESLAHMIQLQERWNTVAYGGFAAPWDPKTLLDAVHYIVA
jgi:hypothetical protein